MNSSSSSSNNNNNNNNNNNPIFVFVGHWRMIMAPCDFSLTPDCYNRQFALEFRGVPERVSFSQLDKTRRKVRKWMAENSQHFAL